MTRETAPERNRAKRVRTGCLTCRKRRRKCDERKPVCLKCEEKSSPCHYGINVTFRATNARSVGPEHRKITRQYSRIKVCYVFNIVSGKKYPYLIVTKFVSSALQSATAQRLNPQCKSANLPREQSEDDPSCSETICNDSHTTPLNSTDERLEVNNFSAVLENVKVSSEAQLRSDRGNVAWSPIGWTDNENPSEERLTKRSSAKDTTVLARLSRLSSYPRQGVLLQYLLHYRYALATSLDFWDWRQPFGVAVILLSVTDKSVLSALCELVARHSERRTAFGRCSTSYSRLNLSPPPIHSHLLESSTLSNDLISHTLVFVGNLISSPRLDCLSSYLDVMLRVLKDMPLQIFEKPLPLACLWYIFRIDLALSMLNEAPVKLTGSHSALFENLIRVSSNAGGPNNESQHFARRILWLCARSVVILHSSREQGSARGRRCYTTEWQDVWTQLEEWWDNRPAEMLTIFESSCISMSEHGFSQILFTTTMGSSSIMVYHSSAILLLRCKPRTIRLRPSNLLKTSLLWHSRQICGIASSLHEMKSWDFLPIGALITAARHLTHVSQQQFVKTIIDKASYCLQGWPLGDVIRSLERYWRLEQDVEPGLPYVSNNCAASARLGAGQELAAMNSPNPLPPSDQGNGATDTPEEDNNLDDSPGSNESLSSVHNNIAANTRFMELQEELRALIFTNAYSIPLSRVPSPDVIPESNRAAVPRNQRAWKQILFNANRLNYFKNYINEVAPWLDMFDIERHFGIQIPQLAQKSSTLLYALLSLSARHIEQKNRLIGSYESLELYQQAIRLLTPSLEARDPNILATCVVLCCLEMMSASPHNWRRHLEGCAALFQSFGVHGFSGGLLQAVFWCYTRMDLSAALISEGVEGTVLALENWTPPDTSADGVESMFEDAQVVDMYANYAVYLCSSVCSTLASQTQAAELGVENGYQGDMFKSRWQDLWGSVQRWRMHRPREFIPVSDVRLSQEEIFPKILFAHWAAISSNQLYHTACILMLDIAPKEIDTGKPPYNSRLWHARRIIGISVTNLHEGCLNNSLQPLWIAGKLLSHRAEHIVVVDLIQSIEKRTGWEMRWRIRDLEASWGYKPGELRRES